MRSSKRTRVNSARANGRDAVQPVSNDQLPLQRSAFETVADLGESDRDNTHRFALGTREIVGITNPSFTDDCEPFTFERESYDLELASIPHPLFVIGTTGQIEYVNDLAEALVGYTRVELVGHMFGRIVSDVSATLREAQALEARVRFVPAVRVHHRSGREVSASVVLSPHGHGSVVALVTPLRPTDDNVPESRIAEIVHDFKNPLATIALELCLLEDKLATEEHPDVGAVIGRVSRNIEFLDCMVQDMLDSCAIAAGELSLRRRPTDLRALIEHVVERATPTRDRTRVFLEGPSGIKVSIDELRIQRVVQNLLQNALKYTSHVSWILIRLETTAGLARVSVTDGGAGMKVDEMTNIFDKYRRAAGARMHEGSGLGLYVSKQIIEAHGGRIGADSMYGIGSRFFFELPLA